MATEDERYRQSSQFRLWSFTPANLQDLRTKTNSLAKQQIAPRLSGDPPPEALTVDEEKQLIKFFTFELLRAAQFCELPTECRSTAAIFLRRFYLTNSIMTYPPTELLKTCLFFGCKSEGWYMRLAKLAEKFPKTTSEQILAGEFLLCQGIRFAFDVRHPFRPLEGAILELRRRYPEEEARIREAHTNTREILKFSPLLTDVYFHYTPSQIMMAAMMIVDRELAERLLPPGAAQQPSGDGNDVARTIGAHSDLRDKIVGVLESCRAMLEEEPPSRMKEYWELPETVQATKPLRKKLLKCRDPDRADLVALQKARRDYANAKEKKSGDQGPNDEGIFGGSLDHDREAKRRKLEGSTKDDVFGPAL